MEACLALECMKRLLSEHCKEPGFVAYREKELQLTGLTVLPTRKQARLYSLRKIWPREMNGAELGKDYLRSENGMIMVTATNPFGVFYAVAYSLDRDACQLSFELDNDDEPCIGARGRKATPELRQVYLARTYIRSCANCHKPLSKSYKCARCRAAGLHARYCGRECQAAHWVTHRVVCGARH